MSHEDRPTTHPTEIPPANELAQFLRDAAGDDLSTATRHLLCNRFGLSPNGGAVPHDRLRLIALSATATADDPPPNIRVNDPGEDTAAGDRTTQNRPTLVVNGLSVLVAFNDSTLPSTFAGLARSTDGGTTFVDTGELAGSQRGNPVLATDGAGNVYYSTMVDMDGFYHPAIAVARSTDGGTTFGAPVVVSTTATLADHNATNEWLIADRGSGNLYLTWTDFVVVTSGSESGQILFARSLDKGATWSAPLALSRLWPGEGFDQAVPAVAPDGTLYVTWVDIEAREILVARSDDAGVSFLNPTVDGGPVQTIQIFMQGEPDNLVHSISRTDIAVDGDGTVYIVYAATDPTKPQGDLADVFLVRSTDRGRTWSVPLQINDDATTNNQWMPCVAVADNGVIGVMFYDRRNDPANLDTDVYLAQSVDGGSSFLPNRRITNVSFPPSPDEFDPNVPFIISGDYNRMMAQGNAFYMVWADNRDKVGARPDPDVFFARQDACQLNRDNVAAIEDQIAFLEDAIASGEILKQDEPAILRLIARLTRQREAEETALARCLGGV